MRYFELQKNQNKSFFVNGYNNTFNIYVLDENCNENSKWLRDESYFNLSLQDCLKIKNRLIEQNYKNNTKISFFAKMHRLLCEDAETNDNIHSSFNENLLREFADPELNNFINQYVTTDTGEYILNMQYSVVDGQKKLSIIIEKNSQGNKFKFNPNLPKFGWFTLDTSDQVKRFIFDLKMIFGQIYKISVNTNISELGDIFETTLPGHMGIDLVIDTSINPTEILAQYKDTGYDLERTLSKLETSNASWRFIITQKGRDNALKLLRKIIKKN